MNLRGRDCSKLRSCHCPPAWATSAKLHLKKKSGGEGKERRQKAFKSKLLRECPAHRKARQVLLHRWIQQKIEREGKGTKKWSKRREQVGWI